MANTEYTYYSNYRTADDGICDVFASIAKNGFSKHRRISIYMLIGSAKNHLAVIIYGCRNIDMRFTA